MNPVRVLLADDHHLVRVGLASMIDAEPDLLVCGQAADGDEAVAMAHETGPHVVLMDLSMPRVDGIEATRRLAAELPDVAVVALTSFGDHQRVRDVTTAGAVGYLLKDCEPAELIAAVRAAARGHVPLDPRVARALLAPTTTTAVGLDDLSPREREVLDLICAGLANKQIARRLGITERTVKAHTTSLFRRIGVTDRTSAAMWARDRSPS